MTEIASVLKFVIWKLQIFKGLGPLDTPDFLLSVYPMKCYHWEIEKLDYEICK